MLNMNQSFAVAACGLAMLLSCGCSANVDSKDELFTMLRENCTRKESRISPKPIRRSKLQRLARPHESTSVDELTQKWTYRFGDGPVDMHVIVETGNTWQQEDPMVFVDLKRLGAF